jgi:Dipeptidyl peptidase IV (DPP IV) N-terminal region
LISPSLSQYQYVWPLKFGGYLDIVPTPEGYDHIALFPRANSTEPFWVTRGEWEVVGPIEGVDEEMGLVLVHPFFFPFF